MNKKFSKEHIWAQLEDDGIATIGITDYAQDELEDIVFVEQPKKGSFLKAGENSATVESVKSASDIPSPISGEVIEINEQVVKDPGTINQDPENSGWLFKIKSSDIKEFDSLMDKDAYDSYLKEDG